MSSMRQVLVARLGPLAKVADVQPSAVAFQALALRNVLACRLSLPGRRDKQVRCRCGDPQPRRDAQQ